MILYRAFLKRAAPYASVMLALSLTCAFTGMHFGFFGWLTFSWLALGLLGCMGFWLEDALRIRRVEKETAKAELEAWRLEAPVMEYMEDEPRYQETRLERAQRIMWSW
jgi:hypothetical protein